MANVLVYSYSGEVEDLTHLFPLERLARVAALAQARGHAVTLLDRANFDDLERIGPAFMQNLGNLAFGETNALHAAGVTDEVARLAALRPDVLFVNLWHGSGFKFTIDLLRELRALCPALRVYGIGQKVDWFAAHILTLTGGALDALVTGLGYNAVTAILDGRPLAEVPNLIYRDGDAIRTTAREVLDVDAYPPPLYTPDVYGGIAAKVPIYTLTLSNQACPNRCAYCVRPENYGRRVRRRKLAAVLAEITALHAQGVTHFRIEDSTPPPLALTRLAEALLRSPLRDRVRLCAFSRVDQNRAEDYVRLRAAGVVSLFFGIESLDDDRLGKLRKGFHASAVANTLAHAHAAGIRTVASFIVPTPGETEASLATTIARLGELRAHLDSVVVLPAGVYPPTEWGRHPERHGIRLAPDYLEAGIVYPMKYLVPLEHWKPLPFTYDLLGKPAAEVTFADIIQTQRAFTRVVREEYKLPGIPDYYFLMADRLGQAPAETARTIVGLIMQRDYAGLRRLLLQP